MADKNKKEDDLDTTTTFADMNVEGFRWYDPNAKKSGDKKTNRPKLTRKEYWQLVRAAFAAFFMQRCRHGAFRASPGRSSDC